ncbi:cobalamin-binding protein [Saccharospirillum sp.]|uniref:cobalamin-binding protein n=2 Tax=Saccharospirillum sp. TaxID=2033801 RepID=UPI0034A09616
MKPLSYIKPITTGLITLLCVPWLWADIRVIDDAGELLVLDRPAQRIVSLVPHATELLFEIGAGDLILATVTFADYPEAAQALPRVGDYNALNTEAILALEPDLLIAFTSGANLAQINRLQALGYPVFTSDPQTFADIDRTLRQFGELTGRQHSANRVADAFTADIARLVERFGGKRPLQVFYQVWHDPLITLNGETFISKVIEVCGGVNVFADLLAPSPQVSLEAVIGKNPEVIVTGPSDAGEASRWHQWPQLQAVVNDALIATDPDTLHRPVPGLIKGATALCEAMDQVRERLN